MHLDVEFARSQFPALSSSCALFDNAGGSVTAHPVIERITAYLRQHPVQLGASYGLSQQAEAAVREGEAAAAHLLGASIEETIVGPSTTVNLETMARALGPRMSAGDEVVVTNLDHEANIGCWRRMARRHDLQVREWKLRPQTADLNLEDLRGLLSRRTRLVAFTHCANVVGAVLDVPTVVATIRESCPHAIVAVDGVAYAPHRQVDVRAWDVDLYAMSLYKVYGPHLGALYGRKSLLLEAEGQNHGFIPDDDLPYKFQPGNVTHELAAGVAGITAYLDTLAQHHGTTGVDRRARHAGVFEAIASHETALAARLLEGLRRHRGVQILGPDTADAQVRVPTIAFTVAGRRASSIPPILDRCDVAIRYGHFYAKRAIEALGLAEREGVVRVSMVHYNTLDEVDRLLAALDVALG